MSVRLWHHARSFRRLSSFYMYVYRWPEREREFLRSCEGGFEVRGIPADLLALPALTSEDPDSSAVRAVEMVRLPPTSLP